MNAIDTRTIESLKKDQLKFFVPSYQRGYRWTAQQINDLLDDILDFSVKPKQSQQEFYCLQPLVVKKKEDSWELIDGQQRLTSIYIILDYICKRVEEDPRLFSIRYETREGSEAFLANMTVELKETNIDYHYMWNAREAVASWFTNKGGLRVMSSILDALEGQTRVIWYEVKDGTDPRHIFSRLNVGKIALTNAELIKALLLKSENFTSRVQRGERDLLLSQLEMANEWHRFEQTLQNDAFWYALSKQAPPDENRIELLLDIARPIDQPGAATLSTFHYFYEALRGAVQKDRLTVEVADLWTNIRKCFQILEEWFADVELFNHLGYLFYVQSETAQSKLVETIQRYQRKFRELSKTQFKAFLEEEIREQLPNDLAALKYSAAWDVRKVLLLFNIRTLIDSGDANARFRFDRFKTDKWDIEHIHAVASELPESSITQQITWLEVLIDEWEGQLGASLSARIRAFIEAKGRLENEPFMILAGDILLATSELQEVDDIGNLALLDMATNRSYKNAIFAIKRKSIIERDGKGVFIPICTKNVFLKHYTENPTHLVKWTEEDRDEYRARIILVLARYYKN